MERPPHWCAVCQLDLQSEASLVEHRTGRRHQRRAFAAGEQTIAPRASKRRSPPLPAPSEEDFRTALQAGKYRRVVVLTGAGVSTAAGVPDFRSPGGLFEQIRTQFGGRWPEVAAEPELLMSRAFASSHPDIWASEVRPWLASIKHPGAGPTATHRFCAWLHERRWLRRIYTQNVDGLHTDASLGLPEELVCEVHGALRDSSIVLYGDPIPNRFNECVTADFPVGAAPCDAVDLVLVMGTSLQVAPFCALPNLAPAGSMRVLVNRCLADCLHNNWSKPGADAGTFGAPRQNATIRISKHKQVSLRQLWNGDRKANRRWKQLLVATDCDPFVTWLCAGLAQLQLEPELVEPESEPEPELMHNHAPDTNSGKSSSVTAVWACQACAFETAQLAGCSSGGAPPHNGICPECCHGLLLDTKEPDRATSEPAAHFMESCDSIGGGEEEDRLLRNGLAAMGASEPTTFPRKLLERKQLPFLSEGAKKPQLVHGSVAVVELALRALGVALPAPNDYPDCLKRHLHRHVWKARLCDASAHLVGAPLGLFIKPADRRKRFTGFVAESVAHIHARGLPAREPVWCSTVVSWLVEYRVFVVRGQIRAVCRYAGDAAVPLEMDVVACGVGDMVAQPECPAGFALDYGVLASGQTALVEFNDGYGLGAYDGISAVDYTELLLTRWSQLVIQEAKQDCATSSSSDPKVESND
eukprot:SAG11_NODE_269_length_11407_cov_13.825964_5_plen_698_part_00